MTLTGLIFVVLFFSGLGMALFRHPIYGLYTYIAVFYIHPPSRWWGALLPDLRWSLVAAIVTLIALQRIKPPPDKPKWYQNRALQLLVAYTVWLWIQNLWALDPEENFAAAVLFSKYILLFYLIYRLVDTPAELHRFLLVHVLGCFYLGWLAYNAPVSGRLDGVGGPGIDEANAFAMHLGTGVVAGAMLILVGPRWYRWISFAVMPFILNGIVLSGSRGAFLALVCAALVLVLFKPRTHRKRFYVLGALAVVLFLVLGQSLYWERISSIGAAATEDEQSMDSSAASRFAIVDAQLRMAAAYPWGTGHRGTAVLSPQYIEERYLTSSPNDPAGQKRRSSHNTFMTALVEQGIPGAVMYVWMLLWCYSSLRQQRRVARRANWPPEEVAQLAVIAGVLMLVFVAGQFVDYLKVEVQVWFFAVLAARVAATLPNPVTEAGGEMASVPRMQPGRRPGYGRGEGLRPGRAPSRGV